MYIQVFINDLSVYLNLRIGFFTCKVLVQTTNKAKTRTNTINNIGIKFTLLNNVIGQNSVKLCLKLKLKGIINPIMIKNNIKGVNHIELRTKGSLGIREQI